MSFIAAAVIGSAVVGAVVTVKGNKKAAQATKAAQDKQTTAAKEAAALRRIREDAGAKVKIGAESTDPNKRSAIKGRASTTRKMSGNQLGGVTASTLGGL